jgi:hypothetical protein
MMLIRIAVLVVLVIAYVALTELFIFRFVSPVFRGYVEAVSGALVITASTWLGAKWSKRRNNL